MYESLTQKEKLISVIGLGYVGLPVALEFSKKFKVIAYDLSEDKIAMLKKQVDPAKEMTASAFENADIQFSADPKSLHRAQFHIIAVPTPVDALKSPDLSALISATNEVAENLKKGDFVIYESTVYPGCTEEVCLPILEEVSGLDVNSDFHLGYSPERINPGDQTPHTLTKIVKVVSASNDWALTQISKIYGSIIEAGIYEAKSIQVAEAAKVIENTQRDLNIALINELSIIFDKLDIDTHSVLEAAGTKWNFLHFTPGLVGGHCIGIDPYYITYKAKQIGYNPKVILSGREVNDQMPHYIAEKIMRKLNKQNKSLSECRLLQFGVTFKENIQDIRNSKALELAFILKRNGLQIDVWDPWASMNMMDDFGNVSENSLGAQKYDAIIIAVAHQEFKKRTLKDFIGLLKENGLIYDIKGLIQETIPPNISYWRL